MKVIILSLNDFPLGVYSSEEKCDEAEAKHSGIHSKEGGRRLYYHTKEVELDGEPNL
jgi:hypothetical protein